MKLRYAIAALLLCGAVSVAETHRGTLIRVETVYLTPDADSAKLGEVDRGREVAVIETSREWAHVEANLTAERVVTGWVSGKALVMATTPDGDRILYGEAVDSEDEASRSHGRKNAAQDAMRLYYRVAEYFPASAVAAEAMYRSADIRWQIEKADVMSRPSAKEQDAFLRVGMTDDFMKEVIKKFPGTKWADLAAFHLIENKICGDWQGQSRCPVKEAELYESYAKDHPQSPALAEALYDAAYRYAALVELYKTEDQAKKSDEAKARALAAAQRVATQFPQGDWGARAQRLLFMLQQGIPAYGNSE